MSVKNQLAIIRQKYNCRNADIALAINVQQSTISGWEHETRNASLKHRDQLQRLIENEAKIPLGKYTGHFIEILNNLDKLDRVHKNHLTKIVLERLLETCD